MSEKHLGEVSAPFLIRRIFPQLSLAWSTDCPGSVPRGTLQGSVPQPCLAQEETLLAQEEDLKNLLLAHEADLLLAQVRLV